MAGERKWDWLRDFDREIGFKPDAGSKPRFIRPEDAPDWLQDIHGWMSAGMQQLLDRLKEKTDG